ncbi:hypothetical protein H5410_057239 [Solanum commersonii]|uniref:Uncharacterized protein n=1 Tax=Solanum commersonii TaxID=4109 RepID=A0A9J5WMF9_SOLCO|nr:hypothetical protein H5410_057239 [Solanum commersonii]
MVPLDVTKTKRLETQHEDVLTLFERHTRNDCIIANCQVEKDYPLNPFSIALLLNIEEPKKDDVPLMRTSVAPIGMTSPIKS